MKYFIYLLFISGFLLIQSCEKENDFSGAITMPDEMPVFPGGVSELYQYIFRNIKYPADAREKGITGTVIVTFVVNKSGKIGDIRTETNLGYGLEEEVINLFTKMSQETQWTPGVKDGEFVNVFFTMPIKFIL